MVANTIHKTYIARSKLFVKVFIAQRIVIFEPTSNLLFLCVYSNNVLRHDFGMLCCLYPHFTKDYFGPESTISIIFVYRPHICEIIKNLRTITCEGLAQLPQSYESRVPKKLSATVFKHVQKQKQIKTRGLLVVQGSFEGRQVWLALWSFRIPSGALFYPWELLFTLCSSLQRIVRSVSQNIDSY